MRTNWTKRVCLLTAFIMMFLTIPLTTKAETPYEGYIWNTEGRDVPSINGYIYETSIDGAFLPTGTLNEPEDVHIGFDDTIYITDTGNNRIIHLNEEHEVITIFGDPDGPGKLNGPKGVYVKEDGTVYVADTKNQRVVIFAKDGKFIEELTAPESPLLGKTFTYSPSKLIVDKRDYLYVVSEGNTKGLLQIDPKGEFKGFFGTNEVGFNLMRFISRLIATDEQKAKMNAVEPLAFSNIDQDEDGFIYTTTLGTEENQVKRLSPVGVDTLNAGIRKYGDLRSYSENIEITAFIDITVNEDGLITALNLQNSRVYQYDKMGNLLFVFGGTGDQNGVFTTPSSLDQDSNGTMYVVDKGRNRVDLFKRTPFANKVHEASKLYVDGLYDDAKNIWQEVIHLNGNYDIAYHAIGKALYKNEEYGEAMRYFKIANSRADYSDAFREYRVVFVRENFGWFFGGVIALFLVLRYGIPILHRGIQRKRAQKRNSASLESEVKAQ